MSKQQISSHVIKDNLSKEFYIMIHNRGTSIWFYKNWCLEYGEYRHRCSNMKPEFYIGHFSLNFKCIICQDLLTEDIMSILNGLQALLT